MLMIKKVSTDNSEDTRITDLFHSKTPSVLCDEKNG
jgi:hypothetical protein